MCSCIYLWCILFSFCSHERKQCLATTSRFRSGGIQRSPKGQRTLQSSVLLATRWLSKTILNHNIWWTYILGVAELFLIANCNYIVYVFLIVRMLCNFPFLFVDLEVHLRLTHKKLFHAWTVILYVPYILCIKHTLLCVFCRWRVQRAPLRHRVRGGPQWGMVRLVAEGWRGSWGRLGPPGPPGFGGKGEKGTKVG